MRRRAALLALCLTPLAPAAPAAAEEIGFTSTAFQFLGGNDGIRIEAFDDPDIPGVSCWVSRAVVGGLTGAVGLAEDRSNAAIACRQTGPIDRARLAEVLADQDDEGDEVFERRLSVFTKALRVHRFIDLKRQTVVYLVFSEKLIDGSPKNVLSVVTAQPWRE